MKRQFPKTEVDRLIWLTHEMHDATERKGYGEVRVTRKDWRLVRQLVDRIVAPSAPHGAAKESA